MLSFIKYLGIAILGAAILLLIRFSMGPLAIREGEYYYSDMLRLSYNAAAAGLFFLTGVAVGNLTRLSPWLTGLAIVSVLIGVALYESIEYRGSHNLLPFELLMYFVYSFPAIIGVYVGRLMYNKRVLKRQGSKVKGER